MLLIFAAIASPNICNSIQKHRTEEKYNKAYTKIFVDERNEVFSLYKTIALTIENPSKENFSKALGVAVKTEQVCLEIYGENCNQVSTYGAGNVYYATFYRDIKNALSSNCSTAVLNNIYDLLGEIISLYDDSSVLDDSTNKIRAVSKFYYSLTVLNEKLHVTLYD